LNQHTTLLTRTQAVQLLGIDADALQQYENAGHLRRKIQGTEVMYDHNDVVRLMEMRDSDRLPTLSQESLMQIIAELHELRTQVETVTQLLGIGNPPLVVDGAQLALLYEKVIAALIQTEYARNEIEDWVSLFLRLREGHVTALTSVTNNDRPWEMLYRLANRICTYLAEDPATENNTHLRSLYMQTESARTHVRNIWIVCMELDPARDYHNRLSRNVPSIEDILEDVSQRRGMSAVPSTLESVLIQSGLKRRG